MKPISHHIKSFASSNVTMLIIRMDLEAIAGQMLTKVNHLVGAAKVLIAARECLRASALICAAAFDWTFAMNLLVMAGLRAGHPAREAPLKRDIGEERRAHLFTMAK